MTTNNDKILNNRMIDWPRRAKTERSDKPDHKEHNASKNLIKRLPKQIAFPRGIIKPAQELSFPSRSELG